MREANFFLYLVKDFSKNNIITCLSTIREPSDPVMACSHINYLIFHLSVVFQCSLEFRKNCIPQFKALDVKFKTASESLWSNPNIFNKINFLLWNSKNLGQ